MAGVRPPNNICFFYALITHGAQMPNGTAHILLVLRMEINVLEMINMPYG